MRKPLTVLVALLATIGARAILHRFAGPLPFWLGCLLTLPATSAACWLGFLFWVSHISGNTARSMVQPSLTAFGVALLCALPVIIGNNLLAAHPFAWVVSLVISSLLIGARYWQLLRKAYT